MEHWPLSILKENSDILMIFKQHLFLIIICEMLDIILRKYLTFKSFHAIYEAYMNYLELHIRDYVQKNR